ncbi:hypothetical protein ONS95_014090 [Cadophora gregata]|uniref:uncharacterized protein n=1 Tax=Cadophora gregata TaxID=51156 RepID=UPI0026DCA156|nr:uncharacterized protein ONS95_014090 [Cadophora gregata]KAK0113843.1 hypothetical protein ONS96_014696 [Cadophora gregata f. sp. sojae]KAK0114605.1 hypothetical protein ONS95_014090 [Cadophora gregata]
MDEISTFLLWYYGHIETINAPAEIAGFDEIRFLQLGNPTFRFPQGMPPRIEFQGIHVLRRGRHELLRSVIFPEDKDPNSDPGPIMRGSTPYSKSVGKILVYMSGKSDPDQRYHNFPTRYRFIWEEVVNSRQFAMTDRLLQFYS